MSNHQVLNHAGGEGEGLRDDLKLTEERKTEASQMFSELKVSGLIALSRSQL